MSDRPAGAADAFGTRWVHVAERDTPDGQTFVPVTAPVPLSRRPRTQLEIRPDGSATIYEPGPDDRPVARTVSWTGADTARATADLRIVSSAPGLLVIRRGQSGSEE